MSKYHKVLGVPNTASKEVVKKAYRALVKNYHPDITGNDPIKNLEFLTIQDAYEHVINDDCEPDVFEWARVIHDEILSNGDVRLFLECRNIVFAQTVKELAGCYYWTLWETKNPSVIVSKEHLKLCNYNFTIDFHTASGKISRGAIHISKPLNRWERLLLILKTVFQWKRS